MVQERRFISDLSLLASAHCGYCDHRSIAFLPMNVETLRQVPLFESLDAEAAHELCGLLESLDSKAGAVLFRTGDEGDAMYLIEEGKVRICVRTKDGHEVTLTEFHRGDFFGDMALLDGKPRSADARVDEDAEQFTLADRAADLIAEFGGSWKFIIAAVVLVNVWVWINMWLAWMGKINFDPYPFLLLSTGINVLSILQAPIILMSQNRQSHKDRLRAEIDYQVNLKNELALNEILERLKALEHKYREQTTDEYDVTKVE